MTEPQKIIKLKRQINDFITFSIHSYRMSQCPHGDIEDRILYDWDINHVPIIWWDLTKEEPMLYITDNFEFLVDEKIWTDLKKMFGLRFRKNVATCFENWFWEEHRLRCVSSPLGACEECY